MSPPNPIALVPSVRTAAYVRFVASEEKRQITELNARVSDVISRYKRQKSVSESQSDEDDDQDNVE